MNKIIMKWQDVDFSTLQSSEKRNGGSKLSFSDGSPLRFQIPTGRVMYGGLSGFSTITLEMPPDFVEWWEKFDTLLPEPSRSNMKDAGLRLKVEPATQFFDESKKSTFPELTEGSLSGETLTCIIEIPGTYYFQNTYGYITRIYQSVIRTKTSGCKFLIDEEIQS
jgi:hypothetical protein